MSRITRRITAGAMCASLVLLGAACGDDDDDDADIIEDTDVTVIDPNDETDSTDG